MRRSPPIVYHGYSAASGARRTFRPTASIRDRGGLPARVTSPSFFFSESLAFASAFALAKAGAEDAAVAAVAITARRPLDLTAKRADIENALWDTPALDGWPDFPVRRERWVLLDDPQFVDAIREDDYDSAVVDERNLAEMLGVDDPAAHISWAVFDPRAIHVLDPMVRLWTPPRR